MYSVIRVHQCCKELSELIPVRTSVDQFEPAGNCGPEAWRPCDSTWRGDLRTRVARAPRPGVLSGPGKVRPGQVK